MFILSLVFSYAWFSLTMCQIFYLKNCRNCRNSLKPRLPSLERVFFDLRCLEETLAELDHLSSASRIERRIWISMESTVKVSCLLIKWNDAHEVFNTMSECQASVLIWSVLYFTSVTIFSSCWSCSSMYSFLVNIILVLQTLECVKFGDSSVEMRWRWRYWDRN